MSALQLTVFFFTDGLVFLSLAPVCNVLVLVVELLKSPLPCGPSPPPWPPPRSLFPPLLSPLSLGICGLITITLSLCLFDGLDPVWISDIVLVLRVALQFTLVCTRLTVYRPPPSNDS